MAKRRLKRVVGAILGTAVLVAGGYAALNWWSPPQRVSPDFSYPLHGEPRSDQEHSQLYARARGEYLVRAKVGEGEILLMGVHHTSNPEAAALRSIEARMREFQPDVALVEGRMGLYVGDRRGGIRTFGESGLTYSLARELGIPCLSFEPSREEEAEYILRQGFPRGAVAFALFLRSYLSDRSAGPVSDEAALQLLKKRLKQHGLEGELQDLADCDRVWREAFEMGGDWRKANRSVFSPGDKNLLEEVALAANQVRDEYLVRALIDEARKGRRVFCTVGMSHAIVQEPVLQETSSSISARPQE